jgi:hypothetical protein
MSTWRRLAVKLFPEHTKGSLGFQRPETSIYRVFWDLLDDVDKFILTGDEDGLKRIFTLVNWCYSQRHRAPDLWCAAAAAAFLEHLADKDERAKIIPYWVSPDQFEFMRNEFEKRRERAGIGKFKELLEAYNRVNNTTFE